MCRAHLNAALLFFAACLCACGESSGQNPPASPEGLLWVQIPGGSFDMGSAAWADEQPVHRVTVPSFEMTRTEITVAQYRECVAAGRCTTPRSGGPHENWDVAGLEDHPVNAVNWNHAALFCGYIGGRLPTESEWEYAAKSGGQNRLYPWGDEPPTCERAIMEDETGVAGCGTGRTLPVCSRPEGNTEQGLCDMSGNLWEWVEDYYRNTYDCSARSGAHNCEDGTAAPTDGSAWGSTGSFRVERGGSFNADAFYLRSSARLRVTPAKPSYGLGFRCAR